MIESLRHKGLAAPFHTGSARKVQAKHAARLNLILTMLNVATHAGQMNSPGLRLHPRWRWTMATITKAAGSMHSPAHPGAILLEMYIKPLRVTITEAANALGVSRKHLSSIINGHSAVTAEMAMRLAVVFETEA